MLRQSGHIDPDFSVEYQELKDMKLFQRLDLEFDNLPLFSYVLQRRNTLQIKMNRTYFLVDPE